MIVDINSARYSNLYLEIEDENCMIMDIDSARSSNLIIN